MITFSAIVQTSANLTASTKLYLSTASTARLVAVSNITANTKRTLVGGVKVVDGQARLTALSNLTANAGVRRAATAILTALTVLRKSQGASAALGPLYGKGANKLYSDGAVTFSRFTTTANSPIPAPSFAAASSNLPALVTAGRMLSGTTGQSTGTLNGFRTLGANKLYAGSDPNSSALLPLISKANDGLGKLFANITELLVVGAYQQGSGEYSIDITDSATFTATFTYDAFFDAYIFDSVTINNTITVSADVYAAILSNVVLSAAIFRKPDAETWVVNANTSATSYYDNFDFNSMSAWLNFNLGANDDGLFIMGGATDNTSPIVATIVTGNTDFSDATRKRISDIYVGVRSENPMQLETKTDTGVYNYPVLSTPSLRNARVKIGKGQDSRYWQFVLRNTAGGDFLVDTVEIITTETTRRI